MKLISKEKAKALDASSGTTPVFLTMLTCQCSSNAVLQAVCYPAPGANQKSHRSACEAAELTALPAAQAKGRLNQRGSKATGSEKCRCLPVAVRHGERPFLRNDGTKTGTNFGPGFFPLEEVMLLHFPEESLHINLLVFLYA